MKKISCMIVLTALCLSLTACQGSPAEPAVSSEPTPEPVEFDLANYKSLVSACNDEIMDESILLSNMGKWEHNYWKANNSIGGTMDYDNMAAQAMEWLIEKAEIEAGTVEEKYDAINEKYKEISAIDVTGTEAEEIHSNISDLYSSFNEFYLLVTSPSGEIDTFLDSFNTLSGDIKNYNSILETLVSE